MKISRLAWSLPALALVAACGAGADEKMSTTSADVSALAPAAPVERSAAGGSNSARTDDSLNNLSSVADSAAGAAGAADAADADASAAGTATVKTAAQVAAVISKGQVTVETKDVAKTHFAVQKLLDTWGATIADEDSRADEKGRTVEERLVLRVPSKRFGEAMDALSGLGRLVDRTRSSEDVTTRVIDINTRVRTQRASLDRIRALLAQAKDLNQVIAIENQLSRRQADLDSLENQQSYLADQTSLSTVNLYLSTPSKRIATKEKKEHSFLTGLESGWEAFTGGVTGALTGLGAVLPFTLVLVPLALLGRVLLRRTRLSAGWSRGRDRSAA